jgi:hypothetical protein
MSHQLRPIAAAGAAAKLGAAVTFRSFPHAWVSHRVMVGDPSTVVGPSRECDNPAPRRGGVLPLGADRGGADTGGM